MYVVFNLNQYKYYSNDEIHYYHPKFIEKLGSFIDVTKGDFTKYHTSDCILGNMHTMEHHDIELMNKIQKERTDKYNFF